VSREAEKQLVLDAAYQFNIDPNIAYYQIEAESNFNPDAVSSAGAVGIAQFMPATAGDYGLTNRRDPVASMQAWGRYMTDLLQMFAGDYEKALAGYNWGQGRVQTAVRNYGGNWLSHAPSETRNYVSRILTRASGAQSTAPTNNDEQPFGTLPIDTALLALVGAAIVAIVLMR
jgi:soluble lytic murein transglycosylase-like protein